MKEVRWENFSSSFNITELSLDVKKECVRVLLKDPPLSPVPLLLIWYSVCVGCTNRLALWSQWEPEVFTSCSDWWFSTWDVVYLSHCSFNYRSTPEESPIHPTPQWLIAASHNIISGSFLVALCKRLMVSTPRHWKTLNFYQSSATNLLGLLRNSCHLCMCAWAEWL